MPVQILVALLLAWGGACVSGQDFACGQRCRNYGRICEKVCADSSCGATQAQYGGNVLVLDIASFDFSRASTPPGGDPASCCQQCKQTTGCNAWVFCNNPQGCGSGCREYMAARSLEKGKPEYIDSIMPLNSLGSYKQCTPQGKWPYGMCSLKRVDKVGAPPVLASGNAAAGWISGVVAKPATAAGCPASYSAAHCSMCLKAQNPTRCFNCIKNVNRLYVWDQCGVCASLPTDQAQQACVDCLKKGNCECLNGVVQPADIAKCFECVASSPDIVKVNTTCADCHDVPVTKGAGTATCRSCIANAAIPASNRLSCPYCSSWASSDAKGCISCLQNSAYVGKACSACYDRSVADLNACLACLNKTSKEGGDSSAQTYCHFLGRPNSAPYKNELLACLIRAKARSFGCYTCTFVSAYVQKTPEQIKACLAKVQ